MHENFDSSCCVKLAIYHFFFFNSSRKISIDGISIYSNMLFPLPKNACSGATKPCGLLARCFFLFFTVIFILFSPLFSDKDVKFIDVGKNLV